MDRSDTGEVCIHCLKPFPKLKVCSKCKWAKYCSEGCQKAHWPDHKDDCRNGSTGMKCKKLLSLIEKVPIGESFMLWKHIKRAFILNSVVALVLPENKLDEIISDFTYKNLCKYMQIYDIEFAKEVFHTALHHTLYNCINICILTSQGPHSAAMAIRRATEKEWYLAYYLIYLKNMDLISFNDNELPSIYDEFKEKGRYKDHTIDMARSLWWRECMLVLMDKNKHIKNERSRFIHCIRILCDKCGLDSHKDHLLKKYADGKTLLYINGPLIIPLNNKELTDTLKLSTGYINTVDKIVEDQFKDIMGTSTKGSS